MEVKDIASKLKNKGLKVTPQRIAVLEALDGNNSHPNAEFIIKKIKNNNPSISVGTIYNILDTFVEKEVIAKVHTDDNVMRYDPLMQDHHHILMKDSDKVVDYFDDELTALVKEYLSGKKELSDIEIESVKINIIGK